MPGDTCNGFCSSTFKINERALLEEPNPERRRPRRKALTFSAAPKRFESGNSAANCLASQVSLGQGPKGSNLFVRFYGRSPARRTLPQPTEPGHPLVATS